MSSNEINLLSSRFTMLSAINKPKLRPNNFQKKIKTKWKNNKMENRNRKATFEIA